MCNCVCISRWLFICSSAVAQQWSIAKTFEHTLRAAHTKNFTVAPQKLFSFQHKFWLLLIHLSYHSVGFRYFGSVSFLVFAKSLWKRTRLTVKFNEAACMYMQTIHTCIYMHGFLQIILWIWCLLYLTSCVFVCVFLWVSGIQYKKDLLKYLHRSLINFGSLRIPKRYSSAIPKDRSIHLYVFIQATHWGVIFNANRQGKIVTIFGAKSKRNFVLCSGKKSKDVLSYAMDNLSLWIMCESKSDGFP